MKVTFLGTGTSQGVPLIACPCRVCASADPRDKRLRSSVLIEDQGKNYVIDSGPDFRQQMLRAGIKRLDALLFTHAHKDHIAGFDDIRAYNYVQKEKINVYAGAMVQKALRREFPYIFDDEKYPGVPEINLYDIYHEPFRVGETEFIPIEVLHYRLPVTAFRVKNFTYITDANYISPEEMEKVRGTEVLVINALRQEPHISHFTLKEAIDIVNEIKPSQAYFTHISHQLGLHAEIAASLPAGMFLAYDGLELNL